MKKQQDRFEINAIEETKGSRIANQDDYTSAYSGIPKSNIEMRLRPLKDFEFEYVKIWNPRSRGIKL